MRVNRMGGQKETMPLHSEEKQSQGATAEFNLGELKHAYRKSPVLFWLGAVIAVFCLLFIGETGYDLLDVLARPADLYLLLPLWKTALSLFLALLFLIVSIWAMYSTYRNRQLCVLVYEQGIVKENSQHSLVLRWDEIKDLRRSKVCMQNPAFYADLYEIEGYDKRRIFFTSNIAGHAKLFQEVTKQCSPFLQAGTYQLSAEKELSFGIEKYKSESAEGLC